VHGSIEERFLASLGMTDTAPVHIDAACAWRKEWLRPSYQLPYLVSNILLTKFVSMHEADGANPADFVAVSALLSVVAGWMGAPGFL